MTHKRVKLNVLKGTLTLNDLLVKTPENMNPNWRLSIQNFVIHVDYFSLFQKRIILNELLLETVTFKQQDRQSVPMESVKEPEKKAKRMNKKTGPQAQIKEDKIPNAIRINRLVVRNGYFEFTYLFHSGMKNTVKADDVFLSKKDMLFYGNPNAFFRSLVEASNEGYEL